MLAPHPFFQERGTPIAVDLLLKSLVKRGYEIDLLTFHEGEDRQYEHVHIHRTPALPFVRNIRPGFSMKKLICDFFLFFQALGLAIRRRPDVIHAVEESVFIALKVGFLLRIPYVYDMDSSMARQLVEKMSFLKPLGPFFRWCEGVAIRRAIAVVPVCDALAKIAEPFKPKYMKVLTDISLLRADTGGAQDLRKEFGVHGPLFLYVGNLESYQGIDLLLESVALAVRERPDIVLVIVGGAANHLAYYKDIALRLGIQDRVHFAGPRPVTQMADLFQAADVLVSPRIQGDNTPMKIYSYMDSGRAVLATNLFTHTQVLTPDVAMLAEPRPDAFARAMIQLAGDTDLRRRLAQNAKELVRRKYSLAVFEQTVNEIYGHVEQAVRR